VPTIDVKKRLLNSKVVYYGPGRSGKTTSLKWLYGRLNTDRPARYVSLPTKAEPGTYVDVLTVRYGHLMGFDTTFHLCSAPGKVFSPNTRRLLLRDSDGVVFVADSTPHRRDANILAFMELEENLNSYGVSLAQVPHVLQYNKCDLRDRIDSHELRADLNRYGVPEFETSAITGRGLLEVLDAIVREVVEDVSSRL